LHQQGFAIGECAALEHIGPDGEECFRKGGRLAHRKATRYRKALLPRRGDILRIASACHQRADTVTSFPARCAAAQFDDSSGDFEPGYIGSTRGWRIHPGSLHHIRSVHACGADLNQYFTGCRLWHRACHGLQDIGRAGLCDLDCLHVFGQSRTHRLSCYRLFGVYVNPGARLQCSCWLPICLRKFVWMSLLRHHRWLDQRGRRYGIQIFGQE
jgi:hypothetical protein